MFISLAVFINYKKYATSASVEAAKEFITAFVIKLLEEGATFVVPVDRESKHQDERPICFDWLILETISKNLMKRPKDSPLPLIIAVQHSKNESQISKNRLELWESLKSVDGLVMLENAGHWNMNSKRMDAQALHGDILITLGGDEGVLYLANLYHNSGKPVIPLNLPLTKPDKGSLKLHSTAIPRNLTDKFFQTVEQSSSHNHLNLIDFSSKISVDKKVDRLINLLHDLRRPIAFGVRLLNPDIESFKDVENYFTSVIKPVVENEFGYELVVIDGKKNEEPLINQDIFENLHKSSVVIADITSERPNCFIELGYGLARGVPVMITRRKDTRSPFDISPISTHEWDPESKTNLELQEQFHAYWKANIQRRRIVSDDPLVY